MFICVVCAVARVYCVPLVLSLYDRDLMTQFRVLVQGFDSLTVAFYTIL